MNMKTNENDRGKNEAGASGIFGDNSRGNIISKVRIKGDDNCGFRSLRQTAKPSMNLNLNMNNFNMSMNRNARINSYLMSNILIGLMVIISLIVVNGGLGI